MFRRTALILCAWLVFGSGSGLAAIECGPDGAVPVQVVDVSARLELLLEDDRRILVAGIEAPPDAPLAERAQDKLVQLLIGGEASLRVLAGQPDRWGRVPALVFAGQGAAGPAMVADAMLRAGLARIRVAPPPPCLAQLRAAEGFARDNGEGIWAEDATAVIDAAERAAFRGRQGTTLVVEGTAVSVNTSGYRTYVNFGPKRYSDFSVIVLKPNLKIFDKAGLSVQSLLGHKLRVRGMLDMQFGPQIEVASPDAVEILD